ncbi:MAG: TIGR00282 family metallophosphoesterase [Caldisericaceae bacterium]
MKVLFLGDIFGEPGRVAIKNHLKDIVSEIHPDFVIANGENAAHGAGITYDMAMDLFSYGIDVLTGGNHTFDKKAIWDRMQEMPNLLRPANFPHGVPGKGSIIVSKSGLKLAVLNLQGRIEMSPIDSPFAVAERIIPEIRKETQYILVDFHAEATSEKEALGYYLDGKVSAVCGTHTHVPTADERILANGTAYITDVGMCGVEDSIIGLDKDVALKRFTTMIPWPFKPAEGDVTLNYVVIEIGESGRATSVKRGSYRENN